MPQSMINEGQVCAAIFPEDNNWHRVVITGIFDDNYVEVLVFYFKPYVVPVHKLGKTHRYKQPSAMAI